ncbi:hypothetical protein RZS08_66790, partial [Arthrospira platensis SPKY1]|nr:hypothetical protein [Arthrospira platensis SPKY1]
MFTVDKKIVRPNTETLLISPFKEIWERDSSKDKRFAIEDFSYIEFVTSVKKSNPYSGYHSSVKKDKIRQDVITRKDWEEDHLIKTAMEVLEKMQREASFSYNYYQSARRAAEKLQDFFNTFDMNDVNIKTGNPLWKPSDITNAVKQTGEVLKNLNDLEEKVDNEMFETNKNKGQKVISPFANPESL